MQKNIYQHTLECSHWYSRDGKDVFGQGNPYSEKTCEGVLDFLYTI